MPDPNRPLSEGKLAALRLLKQAHVDAIDAEEEPRQFAATRHALASAGATESDLLWLIKLRYIEHVQEITAEGATRRQFRAVTTPIFRDRSCFILSHLGKVRVECDEFDRAAAARKEVTNDRAQCVDSAAGTQETDKAWRGAAATGTRRRGHPSAKSMSRGTGSAAAPALDTLSGSPPVPEWRPVEGEIYFRGALALRRGRKAAKLQEFLPRKVPRREMGKVNLEPIFG